MQVYVTDEKDSTQVMPKGVKLVVVVPENMEKFADRVTITQKYCEIRVNDKLTRIEF